MNPFPTSLSFWEKWCSNKTDKQKLIAVEAWKYTDFLCRNYVLNGLDDTLYNVYVTKKTAKELWESLDRKYKTEDAGSKKFVVGRFLDCKMTLKLSLVKSKNSKSFYMRFMHKG